THRSNARQTAARIPHKCASELAASEAKPRPAPEGTPHQEHRKGELRRRRRRRECRSSDNTHCRGRACCRISSRTWMLLDYRANDGFIFENGSANGERVEGRFSSPLTLTPAANQARNSDARGKSARARQESEVHLPSIRQHPRRYLPPVRRASCRGVWEHRAPLSLIPARLYVRSFRASRDPE